MKKMSRSVVAGINILLTVVAACIFVWVFVILPPPTGAKGKNPFQLLWAEITNLQEQIANIQLLPGPEGPQGPQGEQGEPGLSAGSLHLFDGGGQDLGIVIDWEKEWDVTWDVFVPGLNVKISVSKWGEISASDRIIYFTGPDCTGSAHTRAKIGSHQEVLYAGNVRRFFIQPDSSQTSHVWALSNVHFLSPCTNFSSPQGLGTLYNLEEIFMPFNPAVESPFEVRLLN